MRKFLILAALVVAALSLSVATAGAYCGPEFNNKKEAAAYYHTSEGAKRIPSLTHELREHGMMHADQTFWALFNSPNVVVVTTPEGYTLSTNTSCNGFTYEPFGGLLGHSKKKVLAIRGKKSVVNVGKKKQIGKPSEHTVKSEEVKEAQANGTTEVFEVETIQVTTTYSQKQRVCYSYNPIMKAYCRNFVTGPVFKLCKTTVHVTKVMKEKTRKRLVRTEPAPEHPKEAPKEKEKEKEKFCEINISGTNSGNVQCEGTQIIYCSVTAGSNNSANCVCPQQGEIGAPNDCHLPTCHEVGTCEEKEPEHKCEPGEEGTYPKCHTPKCKEGEVGTYPYCETPQPPVFVDVTKPNDVEAGTTYPNFCATVQMWGSDTGMLTEGPEYGAFGPIGETRLVTATVAGLQEVCVTYAAPGEVPAGEYDHVTITVRDNQHPSLVAQVIVPVKIDPSPEVVRPG